MNRIENLAPLKIIRIEGWEQYGWLRHGFSARLGGVSSAYGGSSLNLGWTKDDDPAAVAENRRRFIATVASSEDSNPTRALVGVRQIHSAIVHVVRHEDAALDRKLATADGKAVLEGDGLITAVPGVILGVGTADCVPVLVADLSKRVVAAFHAGWRGTVARIVEQGVSRMRHEYGSRPQDLIAAVGPSIGPCCYSVGEEVRMEFESNFLYATHLFRQVNHHEPWKSKNSQSASGENAADTPISATKIHLDLWEANRKQLLDTGLEETQITVVGQCSACSRETDGAMRYFSHRAEHGMAGRMLNVIGTAG
jgi:YfiH family protein